MNSGKYIALIIVFITQTVNAKSYVYVNTDVIDIPMRSENKITPGVNNLVKRLASGTKLEMISAGGGWTQVKTGDTTGWIVSRYLSSNPPAKEQLEKLQRTNSANKLVLIEQKQNISELQTQIKKLKNDNTKLSMQTGKSQAEKQHIEQVYKDALKLEHENEKLASQVLQLKAEIQLLENNNTSAQDISYRNWFIVGALVLFFGMMIGFILPRFANQRRI